MIRTTLLRRFVQALAGLAALTLGGVATAAEPPQAAGLRRSAASFAQLERAHVERLSKTLDGLVTDGALVEAFRARDREKLLAVARPTFDRLESEHAITHWYFHDPEPARTCFLRVHAPALHGDVIERETLTQAIATHALGAGKELGKTAFALRVVKPVNAGGKLVGYMELAESIDHFLTRMKLEIGDDFGLLADKRSVDRAELKRVSGEDRWEEQPDVVLIDSTMWQERNVSLGMPLEQLPASGAFVPEWQDGSRSYVGGAFPVKDAAGRVVGALFVRHRIGNERSAAGN
jgi:hypothetical protein